MKKPLIITSMDTDTERFYIEKKYIREIERAGGIPILIASGENPSLENIFPLMDGLILSGGDDVHPHFFGEEIASHYTGKIDEPRDNLEQKLILYAIEHNIPVFGICRGMQVMNVMLGGSLYQDIEHDMTNALVHKSITPDRTTLAHAISIKNDSLLSQVMEGTNFEVNSIHHQGVKELGKKLIASAEAPDGLVEAIELPGHPFTIGVQWHPEELADIASQKLFSTFITACIAEMNKKDTYR